MQVRVMESLAQGSVCVKCKQFLTSDHTYAMAGPLNQKCPPTTGGLITECWNVHHHRRPRVGNEQLRDKLRSRGYSVSGLLAGRVSGLAMYRRCRRSCSRGCLPAGRLREENDASGPDSPPHPV